MRMITPATTRNGVEVTKSGIERAPLGAHGGRGRDDQVGAGDRDDLDQPAGRDLGAGRGGHVVGRAGEADEDAPETVGGDGHRDLAGRADHVFETEGVGRLGLAQEATAPRTPATTPTTVARPTPAPKP